MGVRCSRILEGGSYSYSFKVVSLIMVLEISKIVDCMIFEIILKVKNLLVYGCSFGVLLKYEMVNLCLEDIWCLCLMWLGWLFRVIDRFELFWVCGMLCLYNNVFL